ncbi:unnamed protein product [Adineta steineri]|uniref:Ubiquitin-like domain-containing protein n=1 Tax=Adineta steineri TaxID=433720 RepID=A0A819QED0_9BILA|nr:unnamed protein product [Adineta steineri]CAF4029377.1 unnamed protein product [Adineta steineri]
MLCGDVFSVEIESADSWETLKDKIYEKTEWPPDQQRLIHGGRVLYGGQKMSDWHIQDGSVVYMIYPIPRDYASR